MPKTTIYRMSRKMYRFMSLFCNDISCYMNRDADNALRAMRCDNALHQHTEPTGFAVNPDCRFSG